MNETSIIYIAIAIIAYFLKQAMADVKESNKRSIKTESELAVLKNDHLNKHESIGEKHEELKVSIDKLTDKIELLTDKIK